MTTIADRCAGCLLGLAVGDAVAAPFEGLDAYAIYREFGGAARIVRDPPQRELCYTDGSPGPLGVSGIITRHLYRGQ